LLQGACDQRRGRGPGLASGQRGRPRRAAAGPAEPDGESAGPDAYPASDPGLSTAVAAGPGEAVAPVPGSATAQRRPGAGGRPAPLAPGSAIQVRVAAPGRDCFYKGAAADTITAQLRCRTPSSAR